MKYNPPPAPRAFDAAAVASIHGLREIGVTQRAIARQLGVHWRTIANVVHRRGADLFHL
jgi:IS30 family transposase